MAIPTELTDVIPLIDRFQKSQFLLIVSVLGLGYIYVPIILIHSFQTALFCSESFLIMQERNGTSPSDVKPSAFFFIFSAPIWYVSQSAIVFSARSTRSSLQGVCDSNNIMSRLKIASRLSCGAVAAEAKRALANWVLIHCDLLLCAKGSVD